MPQFKRGQKLTDWKTNRAEAGLGKLRIVGGKFRGRLIDYSGDPVTRPMKGNIREALFNLIGGWVKGKVAIDLFAGTGAMGLESLSRGAVKAYFVERHIPTVRIIHENINSLDPELPVEVTSSDTFFWVRKFLKQVDQLPKDPWLVFCCPPYDFYEERLDEVLQLVRDLLAQAPEGSIIVVESDSRFSPELLPEPESWTVRRYAPAHLAVYRKRVRETGTS